MTLFWVTRLIIVVTVIMILREAAAAGPLLWINLTTGGAATWALGLLRAWLGICWFELAGALVARQCGCTGPALHHLRRHDRTHSTLLSSVVWNRMMAFWVARLIAVTAVVIAQKEGAAIGRLL